MLLDISLVVTLLCCYGAKVAEARNHGNLRLVGSTDYRNGRVEIYIEPNNTWGIVCDDHWDDADARVVCRQLGFGNSGTAVQTHSSSESFSNGPIWLDDVECTGHEQRLIDCPHNGLENHNCDHFENAGVTCEGTLPKLPVRLAGGSTIGEGRVEILYKNSWATVCDDRWDDNDASTVCRQLGLGSSGSAVRISGFGQGTGTILLDEVRCATGQSNIFECRHNGFENHDCSHIEDAGVRCNDSHSNIVRLVGSSSYNEGRVEVFYNGQWGTVCDDGWGTTDAGVVCRQLGFGSSGRAIHLAGFGQGSGSIWLDSVTCIGNESTLASCGHLGVGVTRSCSHSEDAGVICSGTQVVPVRLSNGDNSRSGRVEMYINGQWGTVCDDGWTTRSSVVVCRQLGLGNIGTFNQFGSGPLSYPIHLDNVICGGNEANILTCQHLRLGLHDCGHHEDTGIICSGLYNAPIRLRDGGNNLEGRVEIMYQGIWGTICDDGWDDIDATVVCRELGYSHGNATRQAQFGSGSGPVWLRQVGCNGNESKLSHCTHTGASNILGCSHAQDVGVQCYGVNVRLVNGPTEYEGRVEVNYNGEWGTVCDDDWDLNDAQVVCNELGLGKATAAQHRAFYGQGTGEIWLDNVNCVGNEWTIGNCSHRGWGIDDCGHFEDASVNCTAVGPVDNGTLRLVGSNLHTEGGVQIFNGSQWVEVCDDGWDATEAGVVCRQLGFGSSGTIRRFRGSGSNEAIIPPSYSCSGNESMLLNCSLRGIQPSDCDRFENVEVECQAPVPALPIRLADGGRPYSGRVEVYRNGVWGTVCDDNWTDMTAQVVCQQLGFGNTSASVDFDVPAGTGPILMDDINCNNGQTNLLACSHNGFGNHNCLHSEDVGVRCLQPSSRPLIRLVGSSSYNEGRVEVNYNGEWGTVCDDGWDDTDAGVVCRQLGFGSSGTAIGSAGFGQGSGSIWLDSVTCTGSESTLAECGHAGISVTGLCTHNNDAGVRCFGGQGVSVRLVGGSSYNEGRVEVNYDGEWGTVCDDGWDDTDAGVVCRQLGFGSSGTAINRAHQTGFGRGSGSILLDNIFCTGNESTLASCGHLGVGVTRSCSHSEDAGVRCSKGTFGSLIRLVGGSSYNEGRVEVNYNGEWGTVCDDGWDDTDAGVVCRQLGFGSSGTAIGSAAFGQGSGSIWLDGVSCSGNELALAACGHLGVGITRNCSHLSDAGIRCIGRFYFPIRIQHLEQDKVTGRVEMLSNGQWGLVCANDWDMRDAMVACQDALLGNNGTTIKYPHSQTEKLLLSGVDCMGNESQLSLCPHNGIGVVEECALVAGVECFVSPAIVSIIPNNHSVNLYESVAFFCSAIGRGSFSFAWEHNGIVISSSDSLSIDSVMPQDQGQYKCTVTTTFSNFSINSNASAMLNLNAPSFDSQTLLQQVTSSTSANTITISIPQIDDSGGPISHYYIVVSVEQLEDTEAVKDSELLPANLVKRNADLPLYVTASVNYEDFHPTFIIGDGSSSTDPMSQTTFHNIPLQKDSTYYYFIRAYSVAHSAQYPFFGTSKLSSAIAIRPEDSAITGASSKSSPSPAPAIAGVVVAVIVIIGIAVCVVLAVIMIRRKKGKKFNFTRSQNGSNINNPTYSSAPSASNALATKNINDDPTLLEPDDHIYEPICHGSQLEKEKHLQKANHKAASNIYYNTSQKPNNNDDDDDDRLSIKSDDVKYDDTEEQRTSNVKKSTARYSKNGKPKPQPKPRHSKQPTANTTAPTVHYDVPRSSLQLVDEGDYTALDLTRSNAMNNGNDYQQLAINGGNDYQELMAHQPPPPGYSVPNNIPATSTTLESHVRSSS